MSFGTTVALAAAAAFFAAFLQGFSGFGFGIFCMSFLCLLFPLRTADQMVYVMGVFVIWSLFLRLRREVEWGLLPWVAVGLVAGVPVGVWLGPNLAEGVGKRALGVIIIVVSLIRLVADWHEKQLKDPRPGPTDVLAGFFGGLLGGWANVPGPPLIYWSHRRMAPIRARATLACTFAIASLTKLVSLTASGLWLPKAALAGLCVAPLVLLCTLAGDRVAKRTQPKVFVRVIWILLLGLGVLLVVTAPTSAPPSPD